MEAVSGKVKKAAKVQIHIAASVFEKLPIPRTEIRTTESGISAPVLITETEQELSQFAVEFKKWPVPENKVDAAIHDLGRAVKASMRDKGLLK